MMRYVLDTSALLAHYRQEVGWKTVQTLFESGETEVFLATVSLTEFGRRLRDLGASEADITEVLSTYQLLFLINSYLLKLYPLTRLLPALHLRSVAKHHVGCR